MTRKPSPWDRLPPKAVGSRHHYVPQFLLRRFAMKDDPNRVWRLDKETGKPARCHTKEAAWIKDYYRFKDEALEMLPVNPEGMLQELESQAAPLIAEMAASKAPPTGGNRELLGLFFGLLASRGPLGQGRIEAGMKQSLVTIARATLESSQTYLAKARAAGDSSPEEDLEAERLLTLAQLERGDLEFGITSDHVIDMMFRTARGLAPTIAGFGWRLATSSSSTKFILSDTPLTHFDPTPRDPTAGSAWGTSNNAMTFVPLDPDHCLVISPGTPQWESSAMEPRIVQHINLTTYAWAERWIFGSAQAAVQGTRHLAKRRPADVGKLGFKPGNVVLLEDHPLGRRAGTATVNPLKPKRRRR